MPIWNTEFTIRRMVPSYFFSILMSTCLTRCFVVALPLAFFILWLASLLGRLPICSWSFSWHLLQCLLSCRPGTSPSAYPLGTRNSTHFFKCSSFILYLRQLMILERLVSKIMKWQINQVSSSIYDTSTSLNETSRYFVIYFL